MRRRLGSADGANAVEFALVLPILLVLLFGMFTGGISLNRWLQMNHAAREGVRYAATLPVSVATWYDDVITRAYESAAGELAITDPTVRICVARDSGSGMEKKEVSGGHPDLATALGAAGAPTAGSCYGDGLTGKRVQVTAARQTRLQAVFFTLTPTLQSESVARFEDGS